MLKPLPPLPDHTIPSLTRGVFSCVPCTSHVPTLPSLALAVITGLTAWTACSITIIGMGNVLEQRLTEQCATANWPKHQDPQLRAFCALHKRPVPVSYDSASR